jgi:hypothetical protein
MALKVFSTSLFIRTFLAHFKITKLLQILIELCTGSKNKTNQPYEKDRNAWLWIYRQVLC